MKPSHHWRRLDPAAILTLLALVVYFAWLLTLFEGEIESRRGLVKVLLGTNFVRVQTHPPEVSVTAPLGTTPEEFDALLAWDVREQTSFLDRKIKERKVEVAKLLSLPDASKYEGNIASLRRDIERKEARIDGLNTFFKRKEVRDNWYQTYLKLIETDRERALKRLPNWISLALAPVFFLTFAKLSTSLLAFERRRRMSGNDYASTSAGEV